MQDILFILTGVAKIHPAPHR